jgi:hypothetical protein
MKALTIPAPFGFINLALDAIRAYAIPLLLVERRTTTLANYITTYLA